MIHVYVMQAFENLFEAQFLYMLSRLSKFSLKERPRQTTNGPRNLPNALKPQVMFAMDPSVLPLKKKEVYFADFTAV